MTIAPHTSTALFEASRRRLLSIAYRMLGSRSEAEDVVQETWLRWHDTDHRQLATPVAWLTTVTTRLSIDRLRRLQRERAAETAWLPEPWLEDNVPSAEDSVSMLSDLSYGVLLLLERLTPDERAALLLHEVFDCQYDEISRTLDKTPAHCRQLVRRARERLQSGRARRDAATRSEQECEHLVQQFLAAIGRQDKQAMLLLVAPDAMVLGDGGGYAPTALAALAVTQTVGSLASALAAPCYADVHVEAVCLNGGWGAVLIWRGEIALALSMEMDASGIHTVYAVADREQLGRVENLLVRRVRETMAISFQ